MWFLQSLSALIWVFFLDSCLPHCCIFLLCENVFYDRSFWPFSSLPLKGFITKWFLLLLVILIIEDECNSSLNGVSNLNSFEVYHWYHGVKVSKTEIGDNYTQINIDTCHILQQLFLNSPIYFTVGSVRLSGV